MAADGASAICAGSHRQQCVCRTISSAFFRENAKDLALLFIEQEGSQLQSS